MKNRPPFEKFTGPTCKGSLALGNGCGVCEKCFWESGQMQDATPPAVGRIAELEARVAALEAMNGAGQ